MQRPGRIDGEGHIAAKLEVELDQPITWHGLHARIVVRKIGNDDIHVVAYPRKIPITLPFTRIQSDATTQ